MQASKSKSFVALLLVVAATVRFVIAVNGGRSLFFTGPDAPTYEIGANDFVERGFFSPDIEGLPLWASGYTIFLFPFRLIFGDSWWIFVSLFQNVFFLAATIFLNRVLSLHSISSKFLNICFIYVLFSPTHIYFASELMYESLVASSGMIAFGSYLLQRLGYRYANFLFVCSVGFLVFIQPKFALVLIPWSFFALQKFGLRPVFFQLLLIMTLPAIILVRNFIAYGLFTLSLNFRIATEIGLAESKLTDEFNPPTDLSELNFLLQLFIYFLKNPWEFSSHVLRQLLHLVGPVNGGGEPGASTWFHGLDISRLLSIFINNLDVSQLFLLQKSMRIIFLFLFVISVIKLIQTKSPFLFAVHIISAVIVTHVISNGESRYYTPVYWAYHPLVIYGGVVLLKWVKTIIKK